MHELGYPIEIIMYFLYFFKRYANMKYALWQPITNPRKVVSIPLSSLCPTQLSKIWQIALVCYEAISQKQDSLPKQLSNGLKSIAIAQILILFRHAILFFFQYSICMILNKMYDFLKKKIIIAYSGQSRIQCKYFDNVNTVLFVYFVLCTA